MSRVVDPVLTYFKDFCQQADHQEVKEAVLSRYNSEEIAGSDANIPTIASQVFPI